MPLPIPLVRPLLASHTILLLYFPVPNPLIDNITPHHKLLAGLQFLALMPQIMVKNDQITNFRHISCHYLLIELISIK